MKAEKINQKLKQKPFVEKSEEGIALYWRAKGGKFRLTNFHPCEALAWGEFWGAVNIYADDSASVDWEG
jgi:hypothetical protein